MTIRKILTFPDPKLREVAEEVTNFDSNLKQLADDLLDTMYEFKGIGLAAIQIGVRKRIIVADISEERKEPHIFVNPKIKILIDQTIRNYQKIYSNNCRIYIRPSGTEPLLRVLVEAKDQKRVNSLSSEITKKLFSEINKIINQF